MAVKIERACTSADGNEQSAFPAEGALYSACLEKVDDGRPRCVSLEVVGA